MNRTDKKATIHNNFIAEFDNFYPEEMIDECIQIFEVGVKLGLNYERKQVTMVEDNNVNPLDIDLHPQTYDLYSRHRAFATIFWDEIYPLYEREYSILGHFIKFGMDEVKLQKTLPGQGYHVYHCENMKFSDQHRVLAFILYLNDVQEGGETEFRYLNTRIKPVRNKLVLFPGYFTHTHRGLAPLSNEKYILTGWCKYGTY